MRYGSDKTLRVRPDGVAHIGLGFTDDDIFGGVVAEGDHWMPGGRIPTSDDGTKLSR